MNPIYKEKYILTPEAFNGFNLDSKKAQIEKNINNIKITALIQVFVGAIFIIASMASIISGEHSLFVFNVFALIVMFWGGYSLKTKPKKYQKQVEESLKKAYENGRYGECFFDIKFFEDKLSYMVGGKNDELFYSEFAKFYDSEKYFAIHFTSGDVIIFNPDCDREKIKNIIIGYRTKGDESLQDNQTKEISQ